MADGWEKVRKEVTCAICLSTYKEPKMLRCLHTFCAKCLQGLWQEASSSTRTSQQTIVCPVCRETVQLISVEDLPLNFSASHLVDIVEMQERVSKEAPPTCQSCKSQKNAVASCAPCGIFLCGFCLEVHKTLKLTSSHHINSLDDIKSGKVTIPSMLDHKQEYCSTHPDKPLELYCKKENIFICLGCAVVNHHNHQYDFISQVAKEHKQQINSALTNAKQQLRSLEQAVAEVKDMMTQIQENKQQNIADVETTFHKIVSALNQRKSLLIQDINHTSACKMKALNNQCTKLTQLYNQINSYIQLINAKLVSESDRAIVSMKNQLVDRSDQLVKNVSSTKLSPSETVPPSIKFYGLRKITEAFQGLGKRLDVCIKKSHLAQQLNSKEDVCEFEVTIKDS